ncbi:hypothetical protein WJX84_004029 [Apatococcus fuscideae]|uniref:Uncharacterized protein n=1 Tax=Apatococcus fuscideae TaxID=2026836 RepID=A0AAW1SVH5_9CHLO
MLWPGLPSEEALMRPGPDPSTVPWPLLKAGMALGRFLELLPNWMLPAGPQLLQLAAVAQFKAQTIKALAVLGIADMLGSGPKSSQELADVSAYSAPGLYRLLRLSTASGVFAVDGPVKGFETRFRNNKLSIHLRTDHPESVRHLLMTFANDCDSAWTKLAEGVKTGEEPFQLEHGTDFWKYIKDRPENEKIFSHAMAYQEKSSRLTHIKEYRWDQYDRVVDIGGAYGSFLASLMTAFPQLNGTLFDMPQVIENAKVLWKDEHANLAGRVDLVIEDVFPGEMTVKLGMDVHMLAICSGKERTKHEWEALLSQGGFRLNQIYAAKGLQSMIESEVAHKP